MRPGRANVSPVIDGQNRLRQDFKTFAQQWSRTKEVWLDDRRQQFETQYLDLLGPSMARLSAALDEWRDFVTKADRDLAEEILEDF